MGTASDLTLYGTIASRTFTARWLLGELGVDYRFEAVDIRKGEQKRPEYLALNPMGKVPTLRDGASVVTETVAICLYLADRYGYGTLAPRSEDPARAPYLRWSVFATAVLEPAMLSPKGDAARTFHVGWGELDSALAATEHALTPGPNVLGERFSAADVALGSVLSFGLFNKSIPARPLLVAYNQRNAARPAYQAAAKATWPPDLFPNG
jgi:glutathione S-transferase